MNTSQNPDTQVTSGLQIPPSLAPCFQEYSFLALDLESDQELVIERTLAYGDRVEVRWLLSCYGRSAVNDWLEEWGERKLPRRRYVLWSVIFLGNDPPKASGRVALWPH